MLINRIYPILNLHCQSYATLIVNTNQKDFNTNWNYSNCSITTSNLVFYIIGNDMVDFYIHFCDSLSVLFLFLLFINILKYMYI